MKNAMLNDMKLDDTGALNNFSLYLDIIYFSATKYLCKKTSIKIKKEVLIDYLIDESPAIIGKVKRCDIANAVKDIYKKCYKNNRKSGKTVKLSRIHLKEYLKTYMINIEGPPWL